MSERECGCGRTFRKGAKALVSEGGADRMVRKLVCLYCFRKSERIVIRGRARVCSVPQCEHIADVCKKHVVDAVIEERTTGMARAVAAVSTIIAAFRTTAKRGEADDFVDGRIEGLETALAIMSKGMK